MINCRKVWLFETTLSDPFFIGEKDGITCKMANQTTIELFTITKVIYRMNSTVQGTVDYSPIYGGEPINPEVVYGVNQYNFSLQFNMPLYNVKDASLFWGRSYAVMWQQNDGVIKCVFGQFKSQPFNVDNLYLQRITLSSGNTNVRVYDVESINITEIVNDITFFPNEGNELPPFIQAATVPNTTGSLEGVPFIERESLITFTDGRVSFNFDSNRELTIISDDADRYSYDNDTGCLLYDDGVPVETNMESEIETVLQN